MAGRESYERNRELVMDAIGEEEEEKEKEDE